MRTHALATLATLLLLAGCASLDGGGGGRDGDKDRPKAEERARKYCVQEAKSRGMRIDDVGRIEKVAKKQYEVRLRIDTDKNKGKGNDKDKNDKGGSQNVYCRYDDKTRDARIGY